MPSTDARYVKASSNAAPEDSSKGGAPRLSRFSVQRKRQVLGILIMAIALLATLSIATYTPADDGIIRSTSFADLLAQGSPASVRIQNGLGPLGAFMAYYTVYITFGYFSIGLPLLLLGYGWRVFRGRPRRKIYRLSLLLIPLMAFLSTLTGWLYEVPGWLSFAWTGTLGSGLAGGLIGLLSGLGAGILLLALTSILLLFVMDLNLAELPAKLNESRKRAQEDFTKWLEKRKYGLHDELNSETAADEADEGKAPPESEPPESGTEPQEEPGPQESEGPETQAEAAQNPPKETPEPPEESGEEKQEEEQEEKKKDYEEESPPPGRNAFTDIFRADAPDTAPEPKAPEEKPAGNRPETKPAAPPARKNYVSINEMFSPTGLPEEEEQEEEEEIPQPQPQPQHPQTYTYPGFDLLRSPADFDSGPQPAVSLRKLLESGAFDDETLKLPVALGQQFVAESMQELHPEPQLLDLAKAPHLLMAGAVGSGLNDGLNALIVSLLYHVDSEDLRLLLMDPLKARLTPYAAIRAHYLAQLPGDEAPEIASGVEESLRMLGSLEAELQRRQEKMKAAMADDIDMYNRSLGGIRTGKAEETRPLPRIVAVISEFAPLAINAGDRIQELLNRMMPEAHEAGIHVIMATRRPSPRVLPARITSFFTTRMAYRLPMALDSRLLLDSDAACHLNGKGDFLLVQGNNPPGHLQQAGISEDEVARITAFIEQQAGAPGPYLLPEAARPVAPHSTPVSEKDELLPQAARISLPRRSISATLLQRRLNVPYKRAERLLEQLYKAGIVGPWQEGGRRSIKAPARSEAEIRRQLEQAGLV